MRYLNDNFETWIRSVEKNRQIIEEMRKDVDAFMPDFSDSPDRLSRWGHYYFCDDDGGRLIFDLHSPKKHRCEVCGKVYENDILDGVWTYFYRNRAVVMALVSAVVYKATGERKYFEYSVFVIDFYAHHYREFTLHNKENVICDSYDTMKWGCGKMMPQGLNESIVAIRFVQAIEILRDELDAEWLNMVYETMFREMFHLLAPQATRIHNISCWNLAAIGVMGLAFHDKEMLDFTFGSEYNIHEQLKKGVTSDSFWYEGSIHYNFFLLEGISYLYLFCHIYDYDFGEESSRILTKMFVQAYSYAFDNQYLPNPNDGWPNLNLKTFSYIYHTMARAEGEDSEIGNITKLIENCPAPRTILPLSEPYYCQNQVCLEQLLFNIDFDYSRFTPVKQTSHNFPKSNFTMLRNKNWNVFLKYGLNGKSHAHPDIMNVEIMYGDQRVSRDLSNAGYRSRLCNEWHRKTLSHNTVCWNGTDITSRSPGECLYYDENKIIAKASDVYEGIDYVRTLEISDTCMRDAFSVEGGKDGIYDYIFHFESSVGLTYDWELEDADLGFHDNGYQHILETKRVKTAGADSAVLYGKVGDRMLKIIVSLGDGQELYLLKTMDNPVNRTRNSILVRHKGADAKYQLTMQEQ
ncbi:MAG: heparinase II/III family protein [bacterium]|nr:heparinase II/III family protein [bacterium]